MSQLNHESTVLCVLHLSFRNILFKILLSGRFVSFNNQIDFNVNLPTEPT